jgi:hypothetical protein
LTLLIRGALVRLGKPNVETFRYNNRKDMNDGDQFVTAMAQVTASA